MPIVGLIPFVCAAIRKKRGSKARADRYARYVSGAAARVGESGGGGGGAYQSQSCRFAARASASPVSSYDFDGAANRYERLLATARREDARFEGAGGYQSQSCRFAVRPSPADGLGYWLDEDGAGAASPPPEDPSGKLLLSPAGRNERGLSRSLRFSSMRVFARVGGA